MIAVRPDTTDEIISTMILEYNEYRLPSSFDPNSIIVDIGGHIGSFTQAVLDRGASFVCCIESDFENFCIAEANHIVEIDQGKVCVIHAAVWRSDHNSDVLYQGNYESDPLMGVNTGAADVLWGNSGRVVDKIALDDLVMTITDDGKKRIRLLKVDCEGSEWPILLTSKHLDLVDEICGEYHEIGGEFDQLKAPFTIDGYDKYTLDLLTVFLQEQGFYVESTRHMRVKKSERLGLFFAKRSALKAQ